MGYEGYLYRNSDLTAKGHLATSIPGALQELR